MIDDAGIKKLMQEVITKDSKEKEDYREQSVAQFREWIEKSPEIQNCRTDDGYLLRFLRDKNFNLLDTQQLFLTYLKLREMFPHLFRNMDIDDPAIRRLVADGAMYMSPYRDGKGRRVYLVHAAKVDPHACTFQDVFKATLLGIQVAYEEESYQLLGTVGVLDMTGMCAAHVAMCPLLEMSTFIRVSKIMFPKSLKEAHIINMPPTVKGFVKFCMSGLSEKLKNKFIFHDTPEDLHNALSAAVLPRELGGTMPEKTMIDLWIKEVESMRSLMLSMEKMSYAGVNEYIGQEPLSSGVQGSFRKMNID